MRKSLIAILLTASASMAAKDSWISGATWKHVVTEDSSRFYVDTAYENITFDRIEDEGNTIFSTVWYRQDMTNKGTVLTIKAEYKFDPEARKPISTMQFRFLYYQCSRRDSKLLIQETVNYD